MNDNPEKVRILYGKVISEPLQRIANRILKRFNDSGILQFFIELNSLHDYL